jgi:hypothetical protein
MSIVTRYPEGADAAAHIANWLSLAAAPTFAAMALLTSTLGAPDLSCAPGGAAALTGMAPMYLLMSAVHLAPWLRLIARRHT